MPLDPEAKENADYLLQYAQSQGMTSQKELSNFMGQMQYESRNFNSLEESFSYSGERLYQVFHGRNGIDSLVKADDIVKGSPKDIANAVYGGVWGAKKFTNTEPDDGWNFRGRGFTQLTGRDNYDRMGRELGLDLVNHPDLIATQEVAAKVALQYWKDNVVAHGHQEDVDAATKAINGGHEGLIERRANATAWESKLEHGYKAGDPEPTPSRTLKQGTHGDDVRHAEEELHTLGYLANPDSTFGSKTKAAVEAFQRAEGLPVDGKIGDNTQKALDGAVRDKQISDLTSGLPSLREFSDPRHPQNVLYNTLRDGFPPGTSPELLSQATAACYMSGIKKPDDLGNVYGNGDNIMFMSNSLFAQCAVIDTAQPPPTVQQTMQHVQQHDQQWAQAMGQIREQNVQVNAQAQQGPMR